MATQDRLVAEADHHPVSRNDISALSELVAKLALAMDGLNKASPSAISNLAAHHARAAMHLYRHDGETVSDLAIAMNISLGWASRIADELEVAGYLVRSRDTSDRRVVRLRLTDGASEMADKMYEQRGGMVSRVLSQFSDSERETVNRFLRSMIGELEGAMPHLRGFRPG